ncbi:MAG: choice-of-anchor U domain-containing protein [Pseudomonadota bacterium]
MIGSRFDTHLFSRCRAFGAAVLLMGAFVSMPAAAGNSSPNFSMNFDPGTIGSGSAALLRFSVTEVSGSVVRDLAFVHQLPAGLTLASPSGAVSTCGSGTLDAPAGSSTIAFSDGAIAAFGRCEIALLVTGTIVGTYPNTTGDLTSSAGNSGSASADLTIAADRPGFSKSFSSPTSVIGQRQRLTFTIDNSLNTNAAADIAFSDSLPTGLVVASPANVINTCSASFTSPFPLDYDGGTVTAEPGGSLVSLSGFRPTAAAVVAGGTCTIGVDVVVSGVGVLDNISEPLESGPQFGVSGSRTTSGRAVASVNSQGGSIVLIKEFLDDPVPPGETVDLQFTILNRNGAESATDITFTDDLDGVLAGLSAVNLPANGLCGAGSTLSGTSVLTLTGGQLPPRSQCSFEVTLQVPAGTTPDIYPSTSSAIEVDFGGGPVMGNMASDDLFVFAVPTLSKTFVENPAPAGGSTTLEFTIQNTSATSAITELTFLDQLTDILPFPLSLNLPAAGFCGPASTSSVAFLDVDIQAIVVQDASLPPAETCTFQVGIDLPAGLPPEVLNSISGSISGVIDGDTVTGSPAEASLEILGAPLLNKVFLADPVQPGDTVELEFRLQYSENASAAATNIAFTDDLNATLAGLAATGLPINDVCGAGSQISGASTLALTGAGLLPGESCSFRVTLQVPAGAAPGPYNNTTSAPTATVLGQTAIGLAASDTLDIASVSFEKEFIDDPVIPGGIVTLSYTLRNDSATEAASNITFSDDLDGALSNLTVTGLPLIDPCGAGSQLVGLFGNRTLTLAGGSLAPGESCTFTADLQVPAGAASNFYISTTSNLIALVAGNLLSLAPASDVLQVDNLRLQLAKAFLDDPAGPGDSVTLEFTLDNLDAVAAVSGITFTDDLDAVLNGLVATGLPANNVCGAGSQLSGTGLLSLTGASLPAGGQCVFSVTLQLPASLPSTSTVTNITSQVDGTLGGLAVRGDPAIDELRLQNLRFDKTFTGPSVAGGTVNLNYTISNPDSANPALGLAFSDSLATVVAGLAATGLPLSDVCGSGSVVSGAGLVTLNNASVAPGGSCSFSVPIQVPAAATPGDFASISSNLTSGGLQVAPPASATLTIEPAPLFSKAFAASPILAGATTTLTFTIDNSASALAATGLAFSDPLPAGLVVADPASPASTCDGSITAVPGTGMIDFGGGNVAAGAACTLSVDVRALAAGRLTNTTSALTSSSGLSAPATAGITVQPAPVPAFSKSFSPDSLPLGEISELTLTIDNSAALLEATGLAFDDPLPAGMQVASPLAATNDCGGTLTAVADGATIQLSGGSVAAGATCQIRVDVVTTAVGSLINTTSVLTSSLGSSAAATATLTARSVPGFSKAFAPNPVAVGGISQLTFTIDNSSKTVSADALSFDDPLPAGLRIATPTNASSTCTGGTLTAPAGGTQIDYAGGSVAASSVCTVAVDIIGEQPGSWLNTSSPLDSSLGTSPAASDTLVVDEDSDGVPAVIENQAPNNGDGNNDGIPDGAQDNVASLPTFDGSGFITVVTRGGCDTLNEVVALSPTSQASPAPVDRVFPFGLVGFALPCENALVDVIFHQAQFDGGVRYFKFGPTTPGDAGTEQWYDFNGASRAGNVWTLTLADNALGDASGDDGIINDPGGPGTLQMLAVPTTGQVALVIMMLLLLLIAGLHLRPRAES